MNTRFDMNAGIAGLAFLLTVSAGSELAKTEAQPTPVGELYRVSDSQTSS